MRRLAIRAGVALVLLLASTALAFAQPPTDEPDRVAVIHVTKNYGTKYPADCLATVATEDLPSKRGETVMWIIRNGNAQDEKNVCPGIDKGQVWLEFEDAVMGASLVLKPLPKPVDYHGKDVIIIWGKVDVGTPPMSSHKYWVRYKNKKAGPDPEIEVDCPNCDEH